MMLSILKNNNPLKHCQNYINPLKRCPLLKHHWMMKRCQYLKTLLKTLYHNLTIAPIETEGFRRGFHHTTFFEGEMFHSNHTNHPKMEISEAYG